ncbi:hypothetical protein JXL19_08390 [bacterium]|nr:hypothetical protein [bacterium]
MKYIDVCRPGKKLFRSMKRAVDDYHDIFVNLEREEPGVKRNIFQSLRNVKPEFLL